MPKCLKYQHYLMTKIFPYILVILDIGAAIVYLFNGDIRHAIYWFAAATLTASVTSF